MTSFSQLSHVPLRSQNANQKKKEKQQICLATETRVMCKRSLRPNKKTIDFLCGGRGTNLERIQGLSSKCVMLSYILQGEAHIVFVWHVSAKNEETPQEGKRELAIAIKN